MPYTLNISRQMGSGQIYKIPNKKKKEKRRKETVVVSRKTQPTPVKTQTVQWSERRGDNKLERRWMARKCKRERDKRAGGKVRQQEPRAPSHYDSSSSCVSPGVGCKPQSPRPDRETRGDRGGPL